jgi:hypothetical protein
MKKILLVTLFLFLAFTLFAQDQGGITQSDELVLQITTLPEAKLNYTHRIGIPFLQGDNPLTSGNNIGVALTAEVTPISLNGIVNAVWTPIAFFNFQLGGRIGSGWNMELFGMPLNGIGLSVENASNNRETDGGAFDGIHWRAQAGATIQFDMAAIFPGDWNHVVMQSYHEINYKGYSKAQAGESWFFQTDAGENQNGFNYYGNLLLGYQMPIFLNTVGLMAEADQYLYDTPNGEQWGDNMTRWTFSVATMYTITEQFSAQLIAQFRTRRNYIQGEESSKELGDLYYRNRDLDTSDPVKLRFFRVALGLTYKF